MSSIMQAKQTELMKKGAIANQTFELEIHSFQNKSNIKMLGKVMDFGTSELDPDAYKVYLRSRLNPS
jgi:hypothetical protein